MIAESLKIFAVPIASIQPDPANTRRHPVRNLEAVKASLQRYGQRKPIVVNRVTGIIEAGSGTWKAAQELGWSEVAAVYVEDDPTTAAGYAIADNRTADLAEWDDAALARTLEALKTEGELSNVGFDDRDLDRLLRSLRPPREEHFNVAQAVLRPRLAARVTHEDGPVALPRGFEPQ